MLKFYTMFTSVDKRSFFVFVFILVTITTIPILFAAILFPRVLIPELIITAVLSACNSILAAYLAVSGNEGTFKRLINGVFIRILLLAILLFLLIIYRFADPVRLFLSFLLFYFLHQSVLMIWLKKHAAQQMNQLSGDLKI